MDKINWCLKKKGGISIVEPNTNLAEAYIKKAEDSLESIQVNVIKEWRISTAYYAMYFSLYSILVKIGIKCEIHSCTIEFASKFLKNYFTKADIDFLEDSLSARIDAQYYVNRNVSNEQYQKMVKKAPEILVKCKNILIKLSERDINEIRSKIKTAN